MITHLKNYFTYFRYWVWRAMNVITFIVFVAFSCVTDLLGHSFSLTFLVNLPIMLSIMMVTGIMRENKELKTINKELEKR